MADDGAVTTCSQTGLAVPECSCRNCLEMMLSEHGPAVLAEEIKITRLAGPDADDPGAAERREAA